MGFFDIFKKKKQFDLDDELDQMGASEPAWEQNNWKSKLRSYDNEDDETQWQICEDLIAELATHFENVKVKKDEGEEEVDLRTRVDDVPLKIKVSKWTAQVKIEAKCTNRAGWFSFNYNIDAVPKEPDPDDDWADRDQIRVFVEKGVYFEGSQKDVNDFLTAFKSMPQNYSDMLLSEVMALNLEFFSAWNDVTFFRFKKCIYQMQDPISEILAGVELMKNAAKAIESGDNAAAKAEATEHTATLEKIICNYCSTIYLLGGSSKCPNCGAAASA